MIEEEAASTATEVDVAAMIAFLEANGPLPDPRTNIDTASLLLAQPELGRVEVTDVDIPGPHGAVPGRLYRAGKSGDVGLVWAHGGAWIGGSLDMPEAHWVALSLAARGVAVLSVDYRKALHGVRFPVPSDDVLAAWDWARTHADRIGVPVGRLHLGGASAGANLVAGVGKRLSEAAYPASLLLLYPMVHPVLPVISADLAAAVATAPPEQVFSTALIEEVAAYWVGEAGTGNEVAYAGNGRLGPYPRTFILNAEADLLRASGEEFGRQLAAAEVGVRVEMQSGTVHGFLDVPRLPQAEAGLDRMAAWMRETPGV